MLTVLGSLRLRASPSGAAGRRLRVQAVVREPARYLDPGVPDLPLSLARRGTALVGSVKSGSLVEVLDSRVAAGGARRVRATAHPPAHGR